MLRWHGHVELKGDANSVQACSKFVLEETTNVDWLRKNMNIV